MGQKLLMKGNEAIAEAAVRAGCLHYFGYPITRRPKLPITWPGNCQRSGAFFYRPKAK